MKIVALYKTWRGEEFAKESVLSIYPFVENIVFVHSEISWDGHVGNTALSEIKKLPDFQGKFVHLRCDGGQQQQYKIGLEYIQNNLKPDYIMLVDLDEVWGDDSIRYALNVLENNLKTSIQAFTCKMNTYLKHPLYKVDPTEPCTPTVFVRSNVKEIAGVRGNKIKPSLEIDCKFHHFTGVRRNLSDLIDKIKLSNKADGSNPVCCDSWTKKWNNILSETDLHWTKGREACWKRVVKVSADFLPSIITQEKIDSFDNIKDFELPKEKKYYSEYEQDKWLDENIFRGKRNGIFVEFGAYDGLLHSNSLYFERELKWTGLLIEANLEKYKELEINRQCKTLCCGVGKEWGVEEFTQINSGLAGWSGITRTIECQHGQRIQKHVLPEQIKKTMIETRTLADILFSEGLHSIDYLSMDTEGSEEEILSVFPFRQFDIKVWTIENNFNNPKIRKVMEMNGYRFLTKLNIDEVYIK